MNLLRPRSIKLFGILAALLYTFTACKTLPDVKASEKLNILIFYADDLGWGDLGIQGSDYYTTPNIDALARMGMRFTNAYANAANCAPSRACLMTGLYPPRHGIYTVGNAARGKAEHRKMIPVENKRVLDTSLITLPQFLQNEGYKTCIAGKWHLSDNPLDYGFDANFGGLQWGHPKSYFTPYKNPNLTDGPEGEHLPDRLASEIINWIDRDKEAPFFAYFPFYSVHTPIQGRADLIQKYEGKASKHFQANATYGAMVSAMDEAVGKVMSYLKHTGLLDQTIIIFTSDNGAHGAYSLSRPLRGAKGMFYEGGIRVPFMVHWPGLTKAATQSDQVIMGADIFPSLVDYLGDKPRSLSLDGLSIIPALQQKKLKERSLFWHFPAYLEGYRSDQAYDDSHDTPWFRTTPVSVIRKENWKLLEFFEDGDIELYDLSNDISEQHNLVEVFPKKAKALQTELLQWRKMTGAYIPKSKD